MCSLRMDWLPLRMGNFLPKRYYPCPYKTFAIVFALATFELILLPLPFSFFLSFFPKSLKTKLGDEKIKEFAKYTLSLIASLDIPVMRYTTHL